jgi:hypothetical protein
LELIDQRDEWTTPIIVNAQYPQANLPEKPRRLNFAQTGFGLKFQLDLTIDLCEPSGNPARTPSRHPPRNDVSPRN